MAQLRKRREKTFHLKSDCFPQYSLLIGLLLLVAVLPARGFSLELNCTITSAHGRTSYRVSDSEDFDCDYHWSYANQTLATSEGKMDNLVDYKSKTLLKTYKCYDEIKYVQECHGQQDKTANCSATCHAKVSNKAGTRHRWVTLGVFTAFFVFGGILFTRYFILK